MLRLLYILILLPFVGFSQLKTDSQLTNDLNNLVPNNTSQLIKPVHIRTVIQNGYDSRVSMYGETGILGKLSYATLFPITDQKDIVHKKYVDDALAAFGGTTFLSNVTFVLSGSKSYGKYTNGQTANWAGLTAVQAMLDAAIEYISPSFSSFQISGQPSVVEVGTTLSGLKTFTWGVSVNSGVVPTIDIYNNNTLANLVTATANDGSEAATITSIQLNSNGASQSWKGVGNNTSPAGTFSSGNFTVTSRFYRWGDAVATSLTTSASVRALTQTDFYYGGGTYQLQTGSVQKKFVIALPTGVSIVSVFDLDALGADITSSYVLQASINVVDAGGTNRAYNIYEMNISSAYTSNHRHSITIN